MGPIKYSQTDKMCIYSLAFYMYFVCNWSRDAQADTAAMRFAGMCMHFMRRRSRDAQAQTAAMRGTALFAFGSIMESKNL